MKKIYYFFILFIIGGISSNANSQCTDNYYIQDSNPWGNNFNQNAMNDVFGAGNWTQGNYATPAANIFASTTCFVMLSGGDQNANALNTFLTSNLPLIESWVSNGGRLFINAAPNQGGNINLGFGGTTLNYPNNSSSATAVNASDPIFLGPNLPTATSFTGTSYSHATITGTGLGILLTGDVGTVLANKAYGTGIAFFGGITSPNFHSPQTEATNLYYNIFHYVNNFSLCTSPDAPTLSASSNNICPGTSVTLNITAGNLNDGSQWQWYSGSCGGSAVGTGTSITVSPTVTTTYYARGEVGCTGPCSSVVITVDETSPSILAPLNVTVSNDPGSCDADATGVTLGTPSTSDNCTVASVSNDAPASFPLGATTVTWTVTDGSGNTATATQTVTVEDNEAPVISDCPVDITVPANDTNCSAEVIWTPPTAADNCTATLIMTESDTSGTVFPLGSSTVTYDFEDASGNIATCSFQVEVINDLNVSSVSTDETIGNDGAINLTVTGGMSGYTYDWSGPGGFASTDEDLGGLVAGEYIVTVTDANGCEVMDTVLVESVVGLNENTLSVFTIYPNPSNTLVNIETNKNGVIKIYNASGQVISNDNVEAGIFVKNVRDLSTGVYIVRFITEHETSTKRLIINN